MVKRIATALTIVVATVGLAVVPAPEATLPKSSPVYVEVHRKPGVSLEDAAKEAINVAVQLRRHIAFETHDEVRFLIVTPEDTLAEVLDRHQVHLEAVRNQD